MNLRKSVVKSLPTLPKYKLMTYRFDVEEIKFEDEQRKKRKLSFQNMVRDYSPESIKEHEKKYLQFVKEREKMSSSHVRIQIDESRLREN